MMVSHNAAHLPEAHRVFYIQDGKVIRQVVNPQRKQIKKVEEVPEEVEENPKSFAPDYIQFPGVN